MIIPKAGLISSRTAARPLLHHRHTSTPTLVSPSTSKVGQTPPVPGTMSYHHSSSTSLQMSSIPGWVSNAIVEHPVKTLGSVVTVMGLLALLQYRGAIRRRLKLVKEESWLFGAGVTMERIPTSKIKEGSETAGVFSDLRLLELNSDFRHKQEKNGWSLITLGEYMSSLRPKQLPSNFSANSIPRLVQREIEAGLAAGLLKALGPSLGRALLPAVGIGPVQSKAKSLASSIATGWFLGQGGAISESNDKGGIPLGLMTLLATSDLNAKLNSGKDSVPADMKESVPNFGLSALEKMTVGEVVKGPSFVDADNNLISNNFVVETDFDRVIFQMEERLGSHPDHQFGHATSVEHQMAKEVVADQTQPLTGQDENTPINGDQVKSQYDPEDRSMAAPVPVNPRLFPDLHIGWGMALCSHTKREVLRMRLLAILLNKLGSNYAKQASGFSNDDDLFSIQMTKTGKKITTPSDFVQALIDTGHKVEVVPSTRLTTFGVSFCIKEPDNTWTNVPLGVFLESGYEDKDGNMAPAMMPHSGLDMHISGPLAGNRADGTPSDLRIQHYVGIEGFCGWKSHENAEVPFNEAVEISERLGGKDAVRAARVAALYANVLNGLATEMKLPFGGYGLTAVCNDSAAVVQQCLWNKNTIYPMTSIGRFMQRTLRYAQRLREQLKSNQQLDDEVDDLCAIVRAMKKLPNDINAAPSNAASAAERMLAVLQPKLPFKLNVDSKKVMESILEEEKLENALDSTEREKITNR